MEALIARWRAEAERLLDAHCRGGKWYGSMTAQEQSAFREAQAASTVFFGCANELEALLKKQ